MRLLVAETHKEEASGLFEFTLASCTHWLCLNRSQIQREGMIDETTNTSRQLFFAASDFIACQIAKGCLKGRRTWVMCTSQGLQVKHTKQVGTLTGGEAANRRCQRSSWQHVGKRSPESTEIAVATSLWGQIALELDAGLKVGVVLGSVEDRHVHGDRANSFVPLGRVPVGDHELEKERKEPHIAAEFAQAILAHSVACVRAPQHGGQHREHAAERADQRGSLLTRSG
mmetsp:Transcript_11641/g.29414  ORF Transcript_11641/g.29414 Transcript_11641/m.29414 type:complete len:228 (-) Transcript_11641:504-1187(-)